MPVTVPATAAPRRTARPVVPPRLRGAVVGLAGSAAVALVLLALDVRRSPHAPTGWDRSVVALLRRAWPHPGSVAYAVDDLVGPVPVLAVIAVLAGAGLLTGRRRLAVLAPFGPLGSAAVTTVLKPLVGRTIHGANLSFPSGHTAYATSLGLVLGLLLVGLVRPPTGLAAAALLLLPALATGSVMAIDQVAISAHHPTDTVGGSCTALVVVLTGALLVDLAADHLGRTREGRT